MSNRQARREQARTTRTPRTTRPSGGPAKRPSNTGGGSDIFSRGFLLAMGAFAVVAVAVIALVVAFGGGDDEDSDLVAALEKASADLPLDLINGTKIGRDDAPVKIVSYEDFQCPFCLKFTAEQESQIIEEFVKAGTVQLTYKHLPILGRESLQSARGAQCAAEQGKFWDYKYEIFHLQAKEGQLSNEKIDVGRLSDSKLADFAAAVGIDRNEWQRCFEDEASLGIVQADEAEARSFGLRGTPGFAINGQPLGGGSPSTMDGWRQIFDQVLKATPTATASGTSTGTATATTAATSTPTP